MNLKPHLSPAERRQRWIAVNRFSRNADHAEKVLRDTNRTAYELLRAYSGPRKTA